MKTTIEDRQRFEPSTSRMRIITRPIYPSRSLLALLGIESGYLTRHNFASITFTKCSFIARCKILAAMSLRRCKNGNGVGVVMVDIKIDTALVVGGVVGGKGEGVCW